MRRVGQCCGYAGRAQKASGLSTTLVPPSDLPYASAMASRSKGHSVPVASRCKFHTWRMQNTMALNSGTSCP